MAEVWKARISRAGGLSAHAGHQAHPAAPRRGRALQADVRGRGAALGAAQPRQHRAGVRARRRRRRVLPGDGVRARARPRQRGARAAAQAGRRRRAWARSWCARCAARSPTRTRSPTTTARRCGSIHRDVSPSNVMISFDGAVKLLDFGIAKALAEANENRTVTGTLKGKFGYMSPEQVEGKDDRSSQRSVRRRRLPARGADRRRLFKGASDLQTIAMVRDARVEPPSLLNPEVPPELDAICLKALARDARRALAQLRRDGGGARRGRARSSSGARSGWRRCSASSSPTSRRTRRS